MPFAPATKRSVRLRCALEGPPGSGKTYSALAIGRALVGESGRIAVIDTERGSASKYSDEFTFDVVELDTYAPSTFVELIRAAEAAAYDLLIIDSLSHAWMGTDGMLEQVDKIAKRKQYGSSFAAWKDAAPQERVLWDTILGCNMHVIATLRTKTEYVIEEVVGRDGKRRTVPRKVGLAPVQREGLEYEFDVVGDMDLDHNLIISKSRCRALADKIFPRPGREVAEILREWIGDGGQAATPDAAPESPAEAQPEPDDDGPHDPEAAAQQDDPLRQLKQVVSDLKIPTPVVKHLIACEGYAKSTDMPADVLRGFVARLRQLWDHVIAERITHGQMIDALQRTPDDGTSPLDALLASLDGAPVPPTDPPDKPATEAHL